jgi:hypothetical protein
MAALCRDAATLGIFVPRYARVTGYGAKRQLCPTWLGLPVDFVDATEVGPVFGFVNELMADGVFSDVLPFLRVVFTVAQAVMKTAALECAAIKMLLRETVFPESHPAFDGEFQIARSAEEVEMIGHEEVIAHKPRGGGVFPDFVKRALNRSLRQPAFAFFSADGEEDPVRAG